MTKSLTELIDDIVDFAKSVRGELDHDGEQRLSDLDAKLYAACKTVGLEIPQCKLPTGELWSGYGCSNLPCRLTTRTFLVIATMHWQQCMKQLREMATRIVDFSDDNLKNSGPRQPDNSDVRDLCRLLEKNQAKIAQRLKTEIGIAREFVRGNERKAKSLLRQARRFTHLWKRDDK